MGDPLYYPWIHMDSDVPFSIIHFGDVLLIEKEHINPYKGLYKLNWLVVWNILYFPILIGNVIIPIHFHIFQRRLKPPTSKELKIFTMKVAEMAEIACVEKNTKASTPTRLRHRWGWERVLGTVLARLRDTTLWLFNVAMENGPFIDDFPIKTTIYRGFSMAILNNQMVISNFCQDRSVRISRTKIHGGRIAQRGHSKSAAGDGCVAEIHLGIGLMCYPLGIC